MDKNRENDNIYQWHLIRLFLKAETDIINELGRLRSLGYVDYHAEAALERVQKTLKRLSANCWDYVPKMVEWEFYVKHPEARRINEPISKHLEGYKNAKMTGLETKVEEILVRQLMLEVDSSLNYTKKNLESIILGRKKGDTLRSVSLKTALKQEAEGRLTDPVKDFLNNLAMVGVTSFVDKMGRDWRLSSYGAMVLRTTTAQAQNLAILMKSDGDLFQISTIGSLCPICAPLEGRVYSKSGTDSDFPPLAWAYGKIDEDGKDTLENSWLNIHPNCLHSLIPFNKDRVSEIEYNRLKHFSSYVDNPITLDPRSDEQIQEYKAKVRARAKFDNDYRQWERYRERIPDIAPKSFSTFMKHKSKNDEKYKTWLSEYRKAGA